MRNTSHSTEEPSPNITATMNFELADGLTVMLERAKEELADMESALFDETPEPNPEKRWPTLALLSAHCRTHPLTGAFGGEECLEQASRGVRNERRPTSDPPAKPGSH